MSTDYSISNKHCNRNPPIYNSNAPPLWRQQTVREAAIYYLLLILHSFHPVAWYLDDAGLGLMGTKQMCLRFPAIGWKRMMQLFTLWKFPLIIMSVSLKPCRASMISGILSQSTSPPARHSMSRDKKITRHHFMRVYVYILYQLV